MRLIMAENQDEIDLSFLYEDLKDLSQKNLKKYSYEELELCLIYLRKIYNGSELYFEIFRRASSQIINCSRINFIENIFELGSDFIRTYILTEKQSFESNISPYNDYHTCLGFQILNLEEKIKLILRTIRCVNSMIRGHRFKNQDRDMLFSSDFLIFEISDLLSFYSIEIDDLFPISDLVFTCIHLGEHGPLIAFRILCSNIPILISTFSEVAKLESTFFGPNNNSFSEYLKILFKYFPGLCSLFVEVILENQLFSSIEVLLQNVSSQKYQIDVLYHIFCVNNFHFSELTPKIYDEYRVNLEKIIKNNSLKILQIDVFKKLLLCAKSCQIFFESDDLVKILQIFLTPPKSVNDFYFILYSCLFYHYAFSDPYICHLFCDWVKATILNSTTITYAHANFIELGSREIKSAIVNIQWCIKIKELHSLCLNMSNYLEFEILPQILCYCTPHGLDTMQAFGELLCSCLPNWENEIHKIFPPVRPLNKSSQSSTITFLSKAISVFSLENINETFNWLICQIFLCTPPIHNIIVLLIEKVIKDFKIDSTSFPITTCKKILRSELKSYSWCGCLFEILDEKTTKLLISYALLLAEFIGILTFDQSIDIFEFQSGSNNVFIKDITLSLILDQMNYPSLFSNFLYLAYTLKPHLFTPFNEQQLSIDLILNPIREYSEISIFNIDFNSFLSNDLSFLERYFKLILKMPLSCLKFTVKSLSEILKMLINGQYISYNLKKLFVKCWKRVLVVQPEKCSNIAASYFLLSFRSLNIVKVLSTEPHKLFEKSNEIFNDAFLTEIFLFTLRYFMALSKVKDYQCYSKTSMSTFNDSDTTDLEALYYALICTQDSLIVQLCIFQATQIIEKFDTISFTHPSLPIIGGFIQEIFAQNSTLLKLIHYQGYSSKAASWMVKYVPSMHLYNSCFESLICEVQTEESLCFLCQVFSHIAVEYPIEQTLQNLGIFVSTIKQLSYSSNQTVLIGILVAVIIFSSSFSFASSISSLLLVEIEKNIPPKNLTDFSSNKTLHSMIKEAYEHIISSPTNI